MADLTTDQFAAAKARGNARLRSPRAVSAHYDAGRHRVIIRLSTGLELGLVPRDVEGLQHASEAELRSVTVDALGLGIHFPKLDADLYVPALLEGVLGSKPWMAARLGAEGGRSRSAKKVEAARKNGQRGGRPRRASG